MVIKSVAKLEAQITSRNDITVGAAVCYEIVFVSHPHDKDPREK